MVNYFLLLASMFVLSASATHAQTVELHELLDMRTKRVESIDVLLAKRGWQRKAVDRTIGLTSPHSWVYHPDKQGNSGYFLDVGKKDGKQVVILNTSSQKYFVKLQVDLMSAAAKKVREIENDQMSGAVYQGPSYKITLATRFEQGSDNTYVFLVETP